MPPPLISAVSEGPFAPKRPGGNQEPSSPDEVRVFERQPLTAAAPTESAPTEQCALGERNTSDPDMPSVVSPIVRLKKLCQRAFLRLVVPFPRLLHRLSGVLVALKEIAARLNSKQLKLVGAAVVLLLALCLRRFRLGGRIPVTSRIPSKSIPERALGTGTSSSGPQKSLISWPEARKKLSGAPEISFSEVLELVAADAVEEVHYSPGSRLRLMLKDRRQLVSTLVPGADASFFRAVAARVPRFRFVRAASLSEGISLAFPIILLCLWWRMLRSLLDPLRGKKDFGTDRCLEASPPLTVFSDVVCKQKHELLEVVLLLNGEGKYTSMGARLPRGVLLVGPSGTGKTLLARAVAGEAKVPFLSVAASEFVEVFVGQGARKVREVFQTARRKAPCVLFIDELDAVGSRVGPFGASSGHEEYVQTVNQFLMEMDGVCGGSDGVVVIGATNRLEAIDPALLRSGRFDRHVHLQLPSAKERHEILQLHASSKKLNLAGEAWVHLQSLAEAAEGLSGADLENLLNESVFRAVRRGRESIDPQALDEALLTLLHRAQKQTSPSA